MGRQVSYMVIPTSGSAELNSSELSTLNTEFVPYVMGGYEANHANNQYVNLLTALGATKFIVDAVVAPGYDMASIRSGILQVISDVTNLGTCGIWSRHNQIGSGYSYPFLCCRSSELYVQKNFQEVRNQ